MGKSIKEKLRQIIAAAAAAAAVAAVTAVPSMAEEQVKVTGIPAEGYEFVDIAYDGNGTLVALAKKADNSGNYATARTYYSNDSGATWQATTNVVDTAARISANPKSQQQLVRWDSKNVFVLHLNATYIYERTEQNKWGSLPNIDNLSNMSLTTNGNYIIYGNGISISLLKEVKGKPVTNSISNAVSNSYFVRALAAQPENEGVIKILVSAQNRLDALEWDTSTNQMTTIDMQNNQSIPSLIYDMIYAEGANQYLMVDGDETLKVAALEEGNLNLQSVTVKEGANVTGVNANDKYIVVGMSDGTMYYTPNAAITSTTEWKQVESMNAEQAIKNIEFISDTEFVALGTTGIYKGKLFEETQQPTEPKVTEPSFGTIETSNDGFWAKTATFTLTPKGNTNINVKVKVNDQEQTKMIENIDSEIKFGIIVIGDNKEKVEAADVIASASVE